MSSQAADVHLDKNIDVENSSVEGSPVEALSVEGLARRMARELWDYTGGLPGRRVPLMILQERLGLEDEAPLRAATQLGIEQAWFEEFGDNTNIRLTGAGRCIG
jgi:hypothetical protein